MHYSALGVLFILVDRGGLFIYDKAISVDLFLTRKRFADIYLI